MIPESKLKADCTPEIIKKMVELAEGFEYVEETEHDVDYFIFRDKKYFTSKPELFPLLIHRAVEGLCNKGINIYRVKNNFHNIDYIYNESIDGKCNIDDYQPQSLTACECACLHCLIEVLG